MDASIRYALYTLGKTRANMARIIRSVDLDTLNTKPTGFNNTMGWNMGHVVITTQLLIYKLSGLEMQGTIPQLAKYRKGSDGEVHMDAAERDELLQLLEGGPSKIEADYLSGKFKQYESYETSYGVELGNINEAIQFVGLHEALHLGYIMAQNRALSN